MQLKEFLETSLKKINISNQFLVQSFLKSTPLRVKKQQAKK